jgi:tRNA C32,U32 (ribose-2'-O)-methylase TrmJ
MPDNEPRFTRAELRAELYAEIIATPLNSEYLAAMNLPASTTIADLMEAFARAQQPPVTPQEALERTSENVKTAMAKMFGRTPQQIAADRAEAREKEDAILRLCARANASPQELDLLRRLGLLPPSQNLLDGDAT